MVIKGIVGHYMGQNGAMVTVHNMHKLFCVLLFVDWAKHKHKSDLPKAKRGVSTQPYTSSTHLYTATHLLT